MRKNGFSHYPGNNVTVNTGGVIVLCPHRAPYPWLALLLLSGCTSYPSRAPSPVPSGPARGIVLIADGAGANQHATRTITEAVEKNRVPVFVRTFDWSRGRVRGLSDITDVEHSRQQGEALACEVGRYHAAYPGVPVYLVGFSAGCVVVLAAGDRLPADSVERIVLLAPAVSSSYDLRRTLASARGGVDVFYSERDRLWLGVGTGVVGSADGTRGPAAGRIGFRSPTLEPTQTPLASRLRQHAWDPSIAWTGNRGGHAGSLRPAYLKAYVLPLLTPPR